MKLYKFKDLRDPKKHSHFYQIVLHNKIWCAKPDSLNDEDEFRFKLDCKPSSNTEGLLTKAVAKYRTTNFSPPDLSASIVLKNKKLEIIVQPIIDDLISKCRNTIGIVSFSATKDDDHLWDEYGGKGYGACIEINIPDKSLNESFYPVRYVEEKEFHVDSFLESTIDQKQELNTFRNILLTKTKKWSDEEEIRFISNRPDVNMKIDGYISKVVFGAHVPEKIRKEAESNIIDCCNAKNIRIINIKKG